MRSHEITIRCNCRNKGTLNLLQDPVTNTNKINNTSLNTNKWPSNPNNSNYPQPGNKDLLSSPNNSSSNPSSILVQTTMHLKILNLVKMSKSILHTCKDQLRTRTFNQIKDKEVSRVIVNISNNISHNLHRTNVNRLLIALDQVD